METERFTMLKMYSIKKTKKKTMMGTKNMRKMKKTSWEKMTIKKEVDRNSVENENEEDSQEEKMKTKEEVVYKSEEKED